MEILNYIEKIVSIVCPIIAIVISIIALKNSNQAINKVNDVIIGNNHKKQEANKNKNSSVTQIMH